MGRDKALLPFGEGTTLLGRMVEQIVAAMGEAPLVCVAAAKQELPALPRWVRVVRDPQPDLGPLAALATGLREMEPDADAAFVCGCDAPLLSPDLVQLLLANLTTTSDAAAVQVAGRRQPLLATYRTSVLRTAERLLDGNKTSLQALLDAVELKIVDEQSLRAVDPELRSLENCNDESAYHRLLRLAGYGE